MRPLGGSGPEEGNQLSSGQISGAKLVVRVISYGNLQGRDGKELQNYEMCACCLGSGVLIKSGVHNGNSFIQQILMKLLQCAGMVLGMRDAAVGETKAVPAIKDVPVPQRI